MQLLLQTINGINDVDELLTILLYTPTRYYSRWKNMMFNSWQRQKFNIHWIKEFKEKGCNKIKFHVWFVKIDFGKAGFDVSIKSKLGIGSLNNLEGYGKSFFTNYSFYSSFFFKFYFTKNYQLNRWWYIYFQSLMKNLNKNT